MNLIFITGYPGHVGGACTELWHTLKLWRSVGLEVHLIPTWEPPYPDWLDRVSSIGCVTHSAPRGSREALASIPGLSGATIVSFCNAHFLHHAATFRELGCRCVWVNCMNYLFDGERRHYAKHGPFDAYVCQSNYQRAAMISMLGNFGATHEQIHRIPGAFDATEFAYNPRPHAAGEAFVAGRVSRAAPNKFSPRTWGILERVNYHPFQYRVMGWEPAIEKTIGKPPPFAECLPCRAEPVDQFFASLHCYCQLNGAAVENWPRVGLEAMAAGVPIITQAKGGWLEMIEDGHTGFLCASEDEVGQRIDQLATDEDFRLTMAARAYRRLLTVLADQETIAEAWINLFQQMEAKKP